MQIMPPVAGVYRVRDPYDPEQNLEAGMRHLLELMRRFGTTGALAAYNAGAGAVRRWGGVPPYRETQYYVQRILTLMQ
jgi:soluble lytic murein transglycosylase-like protein